VDANAFVAVLRNIVTIGDTKRVELTPPAVAP
jgi:hypothetical protein